MAARNSLTARRLRELLRYDAETGVFTWRLRPPRSTIAVGDVAGCVAGDGYVRIGLDGAYFKGHDLAWLHAHGEWPPCRLDHRDNVKTNNRIGNLRPASESANAANRPSRLEASRCRGTWFSPKSGKWPAAVWKDGHRHYLGSFDSQEQAARAYDETALRLHGEFARLNFPAPLALPTEPAQR